MYLLDIAKRCNHTSGLKVYISCVSFEKIVCFFCKILVTFFFAQLGCWYNRKRLEKILKTFIKQIHRKEYCNGHISK